MPACPSQAYAPEDRDIPVNRIVCNTKTTSFKRKKKIRTTVATLSGRRFPTAAGDLSDESTFHNASFRPILYDTARAKRDYSKTINHSRSSGPTAYFSKTIVMKCVRCTVYGGPMLVLRTTCKVRRAQPAPGPMINCES